MGLVQPGPQIKNKQTNKTPLHPVGERIGQWIATLPQRLQSLPSSNLIKSKAIFKELERIPEVMLGMLSLILL